ncbi:hypothetical protein RJT34_10288 [Clitoria ternatea]|uniref:Uncharacterized protein n=1 Tax=Clitoria ternatea TaxID=43366 RepID=A0AAN9K8F9_CLITE
MKRKLKDFKCSTLRLLVQLQKRKELKSISQQKKRGKRKSFKGSTMNTYHCLSIGHRSCPVSTSNKSRPIYHTK